jgi:hypothetical protein
MLGGTINLRWNIRLNPLFEVRSGGPFNITSGEDPYGTTLFTARPGIATDRSRPGVVQTAYGWLDPNPIAGESIIPRNYGRSPMQIGLNLRIGKTWALAPRRARADRVWCRAMRSRRRGRGLVRRRAAADCLLNLRLRGATTSRWGCRAGIFSTTRIPEQSLGTSRRCCSDRPIRLRARRTERDFSRTRATGGWNCRSGLRTDYT